MSPETSRQRDPAESLTWAFLIGHALVDYCGVSKEDADGGMSLEQGVRLIVEQLGKLSSRAEESSHALARVQEALHKINSASYGELRATVERYKDDGTGLFQSHATPEEWEVAYRVAEWFAAIAASALAPSLPHEPT